MSRENELLLNLCRINFHDTLLILGTGDALKKLIEAAIKLYNFNETKLIDKLELQTELESWKTKWQGVQNEGNINLISR